MFIKVETKDGHFIFINVDQISWMYYDAESNYTYIWLLDDKSPAVVCATPEELLTRTGRSWRAVNCECED